MSDIIDDNSDLEDSGNDITNYNYRVHDGQGVQHLNNISLPCMLYLERDLEVCGDDSQTSQRSFHIEISEERHNDQGQDIPFRCHTFPPEQGFGMVTHKHIAQAIEAHQGTDIQKMVYIINCVKEFDKMLRCFVFDNESRLHKRFEHAENQLHSEIAELNKAVGKIYEVVGQVHETIETCQKRNVECLKEIADHNTQTDVPFIRIRSMNDDNMTSLSPGISSFMPIKRVSPDDIEEVNCSEYEYSNAKHDQEELRMTETTHVLDTSTQKEDINTTNCEKGFINFQPRISNVISSVDDWKIDHSTWSTCLELKDHRAVETLLKKRKLPDQMLLDKTCCIFGISSTLVSDVCKAICTYLRRKASGNLKDIWPAYFYDKSSKTANGEITFIAIKADTCDLGIGDEYRMYTREASACSPESKYINRLELESEDFKRTDFSKLTNCVNENSATLMHNHSKLTMVSASCKISKCYTGNSNGTILNRQCVTLYVHVKGYIPLQEEPFPEELGNYPVDVREAVFTQFVGGRPNEYHENLRMGCAITARTENGHVFVGTLGGFLEHPPYGLCCITCAHVICTDLNKFPNKIIAQCTDQEAHVPVFQPCSEGSPSFGHLIGAVYNPGGDGASGVDVALIKIDSRAPVDGTFPDTDKSQQTGYSEDDPMTYCNGKICEIDQVNRGSVVIKFGCHTEVTRGVFRLKGGAVRTGNHFGNLSGSGFLLHNQIEILSAGEEIFAKEGDSGAFVFTQEKGELSLIGMLEGGVSDGRFLVTPIKDIFKALELPAEGTLKTFAKMRAPPLPFSDQLLNPNVSFRCSTPQSSKSFSTSRTDSAISMNTSMSEDSSTAAMLSLVDEKLKAANDKISQEVVKHLSDIRTNINDTIDEKLNTIKTDLQKEMQQIMQQQTQTILQTISGLVTPKKTENFQ